MAESNMPLTSTPTRIQGRGRMRFPLSHLATLPALSLLPDAVLSSSMDPALQTRIVELTLVLVKASNLKYTIATSVNLMRDLDLVRRAW